jgi:hypothetical protein
LKQCQLVGNAPVPSLDPGGHARERDQQSCRSGDREDGRGGGPGRIVHSPGVDDDDCREHSRQRRERNLPRVNSSGTRSTRGGPCANPAPS